MTIQRYDLLFGEMYPILDEGEWCHYADIAALRKRLDALEGQQCETCNHHEGLTNYCDLWDRCTDHEHGCRAWTECQERKVRCQKV